MVVASIGGKVQRTFDVFFAWLPHLVAALIVLILGYLVAKIIAKIVGRVLHRAGLDRALHKGQGGSYIQRITSSPSGLIGRIVFWALFLGAISLAVSVLGIEALKNFVAAIYGYLPNVLAAVLIFLVAGAIAAAAAALVARTMGDTATGKVLATAVPVLVMTVATFMILDQLRIAHNIVVITYAAVVGAVALGSALAFGLGGREVAGEMLRGAYAKGQEGKEQVKQDLQQGKDRAQQEAGKARERLDAGSGPDRAARLDPGTGGATT